MFLQTLTLATCLIAAPDSESLDGTRLLIDALVQMKEFEDERLGRFPPQFILTWKQDPSSFSDHTPVDPDEHRARLESLQPLISEFIEAMQAEPGPFDVSMMPERFRENMIHLERSNALLLLLTDAEQLALDGKPADAVTRYIAACGLIELGLRDRRDGGFSEQTRDPTEPHAYARRTLDELRRSLCLTVPYIDEPNRSRLAQSVAELEELRVAAVPLLPWRYTYAMFESASTYYTSPLVDWGESVAEAASTLLCVITDELPACLEVLPLDLVQVLRETPAVRAIFWPGIGMMHASVIPSDDPVLSLHRYAHAAIRASDGDFGIAAQGQGWFVRSYYQNWFRLTDNLAAIQHLIAGSPAIEVKPGPTAVTFAGLRGAFLAELDGAERGRLESTKRAVQLASMLLDFVELRGADTLDEIQRETMLRDLDNLRPDDPLRFEENMKRDAEHIYIDMFDQINTKWLDRQSFLELAPAWFADRDVFNAAHGVQQIAAAIDPGADFQQRLHDFARGWLGQDMGIISYDRSLNNQQSSAAELRKLQFPADKAAEPWDAAYFFPQDLTRRSPMAVYIRRDWFDDLAAVQEGTRALWELRDLLETD